MLAFITSLGSILPVILLILVGYISQRKGLFDENFSNNISRLIMNIVLPSSVFTSVLKYLTIDLLFELSTGFIYTFVAVILCFLIGYIFSKVLKVRVGRRGVFISMFPISNCIFIGLPLNMALFGEQGLPYFFVYYITNTIATWTVSAIIVANDNEEKRIKRKIEWKKLIPIPLASFLLGIAFLIFNIEVPKFINSTLTYLGSAVTPLSLMYIGFVSSKSNFKGIKIDKDLVFSMVGRFIIAPLIMFLLVKFGYNIIGEMKEMEFQIFIIQSATAGAAVMPILVNEAKGDTEFATNVTTLSMVLCMIIIPLISTILGL